MGDHLKKVRSGDPLKIPAATYNAFVDAARYVRNRQEVGGVSPAARTPGTVLVRNASAALVQRHYVLGITGVEMDPTSSLPIAYSDPVMTCNTPTANHMGRFVVTAQPIPPGELGWAYIDGVCWTKVIVQTGMEAYEYADPYEGLTVGLVAVVEGSAKILWKPAGVGLLWAVVRLGVGSSIQVRPVKVYNDGGASGGYDEGTDTWSSCDYTYEVREMDGTTVIATDKTPKNARNANTAYRVAGGGTLGLWDCVNEELLIAYDETELTRTDCSE